jgi:hypothetical protein
LPAKNNLGDDTKDSDVGANGISHKISIDGTLAATDTLRNNPHIDAGFVLVGSIGDKVFVDTNKDGKQDAGEAGVDGVRVYLLNSTGARIDSTTTAGGGKYLFSNLPAGTYSVEFKKSTIPAIYSGFTTKDGTTAGTTDANDSDADATTGKTASVTLAPVLLSASSTAADSLKTNNLTLDAGVLPAVGSIGDFVWKDLDKNGKQDAGEDGIKDVVVELYQTDANGAIVGAAIQTTTTNASGNYLFSNLASGTYKVKFVLSSVPEAYRVFTSKNSTPTDDAKDSDADPASGLSQNITINVAGTGIAKDNLTIDAGFVLACVPPSTTAIITPPTCAGAVAQSNGMLRLIGFTTEKYQYTTGSTFTGTATPASPTAIPSNSVLISNLANTAQTFTVRVYSATDNTCYIDRVVTLVPVVCVCPPAVCAPIGVQIRN